MGTDSQRVAALFRGDWDRANVDHPRLYPGDRIQIARRAHEYADLWEFPDPRLFVVALDFRISTASSFPCGGEAMFDQTVYFKRAMDRREVGLSLYHGLSHGLLKREGWEHTEADVWLLTGDLAVPQEMLRRWPLSTILRYAYAPEWFLRAWHATAARSVQPLRRVA